LGASYSGDPNLSEVDRRQGDELLLLGYSGLSLSVGMYNVAAEVNSMTSQGGKPGGQPRPSPNFKPPTNEPQYAPKVIPEGWKIRKMPPTEQYPNGYWRFFKPLPDGKWQPIDASTMKPGTDPETHIPFPPK
jgi:hypothetical protein